MDSTVIYESCIKIEGACNSRSLLRAAEHPVCPVLLPICTVGLLLDAPLFQYSCGMLFEEFKDVNSPAELSECDCWSLRKFPGTVHTRIVILARKSSMSEGSSACFV